MSEPEDLKRENEALRGRIATLNAAILRINASLDLDTVLDEVVESARALTGARLGFIATVDEAGAPDGFVFSGVTPEEQRELLAWPDSVRLFEHLRSLPGPLRLADLGTYVRALGIEPAPTFSRTFQGTPMRHRGAEVGSFFLADKADGEAFTVEDEEVLTLFASQAASAIANARIHRGERRARADLEALVETSPVGVLVFDAESGRPVSFNREARRIAESLRQPGRPPEQLLEVLSFRRADGSEVSLRDLPIDQLLQSGETMRAEEVVLSVPDGRSVRTLINAAPVQGEGGRRCLPGDHHPGPGAARRDRAAADRVPGAGEPRAAGAAGRHQGIGDDAAGGRRGARPGRDARVSTASSPSSPTTCVVSSATCSMRAASTRARSRWPRNPRSWPSWWSGRGAPSWAAVGGTASPSTFPSACPARWPTAGASCRC